MPPPLRVLAQRLRLCQPRAEGEALFSLPTHHVLCVIHERAQTLDLVGGIEQRYGDALVAEKVTFGSWSLPIKFTRNENGGSCSPGCHKAYSFARKGAAKMPEPPKPDAKKK